ncbi:MAG: 3-isopropylmalate dehydrogenase [Dehalococcoidia bacterium]
MKFKILVLPGDGIGPEVMAEARRVLDAVGKRFGHEFVQTEGLVGGIAIDETGNPLPPQTLDLAKRADAVLLAAVGGPKWDNPQAKVRPEQGLLGLRKALKLFANVRPVRTTESLLDSSSIKASVLRGVDLVVIRELTGGLYFGRPQRRWTNSRGRQAVDTLRYSEREIARILRFGFELARIRRRKLTSVDKANILDSSRLWREIATEMSAEYPDVTTEHLLVDACAMHLIRRPADFDVIVTENMFGDILTDEASMLAGSLGMLPSASVGRLRRDGTGVGLYEPIHGSAPDIAGQGKANPIGMILSLAMMLRLSCGLEVEATAVEGAVAAVLDAGRRTPDLAASGEPAVGTPEMGKLIVEAMGSAHR